MKRVLQISTILVACAIIIVACAIISSAQARSFGGYECTEDCSGHAAGYEWAKRNGITDPSDCPMARSPSLGEGCRVYADKPSRGRMRMTMVRESSDRGAAWLTGTPRRFCQLSRLRVRYRLLRERRYRA